MFYTQVKYFDSCIILSKDVSAEAKFLRRCIPWSSLVPRPRCFGKWDGKGLIRKYKRYCWLIETALIVEEY